MSATDTTPTARVTAKMPTLATSATAIMAIAAKISAVLQMPQHQQQLLQVIILFLYQQTPRKNTTSN